MSKKKCKDPKKVEKDDDEIVEETEEEEESNEEENTDENKGEPIHFQEERENLQPSPEFLARLM